MNQIGILKQRLARLQLSGTAADSIESVLTNLIASQSQEYHSAK